MIHCAAGIHRTGTFAMALLTLCEYTFEDSLNKIKEMRLHTYNQCGMTRF